MSCDDTNIQYLEDYISDGHRVDDLYFHFMRPFFSYHDNTINPSYWIHTSYFVLKTINEYLHTIRSNYNDKYTPNIFGNADSFVNTTIGFFKVSSITFEEDIVKKNCYLLYTISFDSGHKRKRIKTFSDIINALDIIISCLTKILQDSCVMYGNSIYLNYFSKEKQKYFDDMIYDLD